MTATTSQQADWLDEALNEIEPLFDAPFWGTEEAKIWYEGIKRAKAAIEAKIKADYVPKDFPYLQTSTQLKVKAILAVKELTGLTLGECKALVDNNPNLTDAGRLYTEAEVLDRETAILGEARQQLAEEIVSNSVMSTGSLHGGKDTFTIEKRKLWELAAIQNSKELKS